jgi:hypothetical protein
MPRQGAHVFVVDKYSFPVHSDRLFCGVKNPQSLWQRVGVYSDLFATRPGDLVFFYQRRIDEGPEDRGFRGIYRVDGPPFRDSQTITSGTEVVLGECPSCCSPLSEKSSEDGSGEARCPTCKNPTPEGQHILPHRLPLRLEAYYPKPVDDNSAYIDRTDEGDLWTMIFRKQFGRGRERSINHILPEEAAKIIRLLNRANDGRPGALPNGFPSGYPPSTTRQSIQLNLPNLAPFTAESYLYAWLNQNIDSPSDANLRKVFGPVAGLEYFGNQVLYGIGGDTADYLVLHAKLSGESSPLDVELGSDLSRKITDQGGRYAASVVEIKKDAVDVETLAQVDRYAYYIAQVASANCLPIPPRYLLIRPVLLGFVASLDVRGPIQKRAPRVIPLRYPGNRQTDAIVLPPTVMTYSLASSGLKVSLAP